MGHSFHYGVTAKQTLERHIIKDQANSGMCVGVGKTNEIKAARPTGGNLLPTCATGPNAGV